MTRAMLLVFHWSAPAVFAVSFLMGYRDSPPRIAIAIACSALALISGIPPFLVPSTGIRTAAGVTSLLVAFCAAGIMDNVLKHNSYSGYGAMFLIPMAAVVLLAQITLAIVVSARRVG
jgi:hypothetical protein